ncbi:CSMD3 [Branchiostoma lanceolatum]|uniref:CSMD3 protein n=1 Tax=Branchiostoma lanceolatum TaxID=7740 RepID=A0A8K0AJ15_BRALA|nr:CSMD3 [Branchiostoma lanceolatum]
MRSLVWISAILPLLLLVTIQANGWKCPRIFRKRGCRPLVIRNTIRTNCQPPFKCGDECHYECVAGCVRRSGAKDRTCKFGRYWYGGRGLRCSCRPCRAPPVVRNADVLLGIGCSAPFKAGTVCDYQCNPGFRKVGGGETKMCVDSQWRGAALNCEARQCSTLFTPAFGSITPAGPHYYPTQVTFSCNTGYVRNGSSDSTCQADGRWSNVTPICTPVQCPLLTAPTNGLRTPPTGANSNFYQNVVTFTCNTGYVRNGAIVVTCRADGTWSNSVPTCTRVQCPLLKAPTNGLRTPPTGANFYQDTVTFTCNTGYVRNGTLDMICQADGTWSDPVPTCTPRQCPSLTAPANGARTPPTGANFYQDSVRFTCNTGYERNGTNNTTCQADGTWSDPVPTCTPRQCLALTAPAFGALSPTGATSYQTVVTFTCNPGFALNGALNTTCQADATWSNPVPTCTPTCGNLNVFNSDSGSFSSPGWPDPYPLSTNCTWQINVNSGKVVLIRFDDFDLEHGGRTCIWDSLRIHDGPNMSAPMIANLCGSYVGPVTTTGSSAFVVFHSDESVTDSGFFATFKAWNDTLIPYSTTVSTQLPPDQDSTTVSTQYETANVQPYCGNPAVISGNFGSFSSPGYPSNYPNNAYCSWQISINTSVVIAIRFNSFDLESGGSSCPYDYLDVYDGLSTAAPRLARLCGSSAHTIFTTGRNAFVVFRTDGSVTGSGFSANFTAESSRPVREWEPFNFTYDNSCTSCDGERFVRPSSYTYGGQILYVGVVLCSPTQYKILLSDNITGTFRNIGDRSGHGEDHCELVGASSDPPSSSLDPDYRTCKGKGFWRLRRGYTFRYGSIGDGSINGYRRYGRWYRCGVTIPQGEENWKCDFDADQCNTMATTSELFGFRWIRHSGSTLSLSTGPSADHTDGFGRYMYTEANSGSTGATASLMLPVVRSDGQHCLRWFYHMYGSDMGTQNVHVSQPQYPDMLVWTRSGNQGNRWLHAWTPISTNTSVFQIRFEGVRGAGYTSDMAIDDIDLEPGSCACRPEQFQCNDSQCVPLSAKCNGHADCLDWSDETNCSRDENGWRCDFDADQCNSTTTPASGFRWIRRFGSTLSSLTGPSADHTDGTGFYLYTEASSGSTGATASLALPIIRSDGQHCLRWFYHMYGSDMGTLNVYVSQPQYPDMLVWARTGDQGNRWHPATTSVFTNASVFQIRFEGVRGAGYRSDIAIDDVTVRSDLCSSCAADQFSCWDGSCISFSLACDGNSDCHDGSDEVFCSHTTTQPTTSRDITSFPMTPTTTTLNCGNPTVLTGFSGNFTSPGYPGNYPDNARCSWQITVSSDKIVVIRFTEFNLEYDFGCDYDPLTVYDGPSEAAPVLATLCGSSARSVSTTGSSAFLIFTSDGSVTESGFYATFTAGDPPRSCSPDEFTCRDGDCINMTLSCDGTRDCSDGSDEINCAQLTTSRDGTSFPTTTPPTITLNCGNPTVLTGFSGNFTSPGYPGNYPDNARCSWQITVSSDKIVVIRFTEFNLEYYFGCDYDALTVHDGPNATAPVLATLCGSSAGSVSTTGNSAFLVFTSDGSVTWSGFYATFTAGDPPRTCSTEEFTCWNGDCINMTLTCDGTRDCADGTDEINCVNVGSKCGVPAIQPTFPIARIVGGNAARPGSWPWQVYLLRYGSFHCGGNLIHPLWILTAAHCVEEDLSPSSYNAILGKYNRYITDPTEEQLPVSKIISHSGYSTNPTNKDLALLKLTRPVTLNRHVWPVCLVSGPEDDPAEGTNCVITGWGNTQG